MSCLPAHELSSSVDRGYKKVLEHAQLSHGVSPRVHALLLTLIDMETGLQR